MADIISIKGKAAPIEEVKPEPNADLVAALEQALGYAKEGLLTNFIGIGFPEDGTVYRLIISEGNNPYEMLGGLAWLKWYYSNIEFGEDDD